MFLTQLAPDEQLFDNHPVLTVHDIEGLRRSAAMAPLSRDEVNRILDACDQLIRDRAQIATVLAELPTSWATVRAALNEPQRLIR